MGLIWADLYTIWQQITKMTTLKIKYSYQEVGEFTNEIDVSVDSFLDIFNNHANDIIHFAHSWSIRNRNMIYFLRNSDSNLFIILHYSKDFYEITSSVNGVIKTGQFYLDDIKLLSENFILERYYEVEKCLEKSNIKPKTVVDRFKEKDFIYKYKPRHFGFLIELIVALIVPIMLLIIVILNFQFIFLVSFLLFSSYPIALIKIEQQYRKISKKTILKISNGNDEFLICLDKIEYKLNKTDVKTIQITNASGFRNPFAFYDFTTLFLENGQKFDIPNKVINPILLQFKFSDAQINTIEKFYPYIKN